MLTRRAHARWEGNLKAGKGRVDFVEIVTSSGDAAFDKEWKKTLADWRYVPAIGADNQPVESHSRVTYKNNGISERPAAPDGLHTECG